LTTELEIRRDNLLSYLELDPENFSLLCEAGDILLQLGDTAHARPLLEKALALHEDDLGAMYRMAVLLSFEKEYESSLDMSQKILSAGQYHPTVRRQHTLTLIHLGKYAEAEPFLKSLLDEKTEFSDLPHLYIRTLHYLGKIDEAIAYATGHCAKEPEDAVSSGMLSMLYLDSDRIAEAAQVAQKALENDSKNLDALITAGSTSLAFEREDQANHFFERALEISPHNGRTLLGLGLVAMMRGDLPCAATWLESATSHMPEHLGTWNTLAWAHILRRNLDAAQETLEKCLEIDATFGETHGSLAVVAALRGQWDEAKTLSTKALRLQPNSFAGHYAKSLLLIQQGRPQKATELINATLDGFITPGGGNLAGLIQRFAAKNSKGPTGGDKLNQHQLK
jgi:tetratricopeptide (TPR) repeat protein